MIKANITVSNNAILPGYTSGGTKKLKKNSKINELLIGTHQYLLITKNILNQNTLAMRSSLIKLKEHNLWQYVE